MQAFDVSIVDPSDVRVDARGQGRIVLAVHNQLERSAKAHLRLLPGGAEAAQPDWLALDRTQVPLEANGSSEVHVELALPSDVQNGNYGFQVLVGLGPDAPPRDWARSEMLVIPVHRRASESPVGPANREVRPEPAPHGRPLDPAPRGLAPPPQPTRDTSPPVPPSPWKRRALIGLGLVGGLGLLVRMLDTEERREARSIAESERAQRQAEEAALTNQPERAAIVVPRPAPTRVTPPVPARPRDDGASTYMLEREAVGPKEHLGSSPRARRIRQWLEGKVIGGDYWGARDRKVILQVGSDHYKLHITSQLGLKCKVVFGEQGNPAQLKACREVERNTWGRVSPVIRLHCSKQGSYTVCTGNYKHSSEWEDGNARLRVSLRED